MNPNKKLRILVVEDDFMVSEMIRGRVEDLGYTVVGEAQDGAQAVKLVQSLRPDLVLMDIEMPGMDGIEATRRIYESYSTPVVILTAYGSPQLLNRASAVGAGAYLLKPPKTKEIERAITIALARFNDMLALGQLNQDLDAFAHTAAHELKNPLGLILGYAELLKERIDPSAEHIKYLDMLIRNVYKMRNIIEELQLLAGVRKAEVELTPLNMEYIVFEAQQRLMHMVQQYQVEFDIPERWPQAIGYAPWVEEVWVNYFSNGIKYGGTPPSLQLGATEQPDGMVRFWLRDNGPGLSLEKQNELFAPFIRLNQAQATGHGLGLSIARRIVEKLGGQVGVESEGVPGKGSLFFFTLPPKRTNSAEAGQAEERYTLRQNNKTNQLQ